MMRRSTFVKTMILVASTLCRSTVQCFFLPNPFRNMQSVSSFTAQPITLKVPKDQINDLKQAIQTNPSYLKHLLSQSASPNGIGQPISLPPAGVGRTKGISNLSPLQTNSYPSAGRSPVTVALPTVTTIGGQQFYLTSRANLLWNRGANLLKNAASAIASPLSTMTMPTGYNNPIGLNQGNVPTLITNNKINMKIPKENDEDDEEEEDEEEEEEEEEEIQSTKKPKNKGGNNKNKYNVKRNKNKVKEDSNPEESSEGENSSDEEEQSEEKSKRKSPTKKRDESSGSASASASASASTSASASESGSASGSASDETNENY